MFSKEKVRNCIKERRKKVGVGAQELADALGTNKVTVYRWECGERIPELESLWKLADFYDISIDELVGRK